MSAFDRLYAELTCPNCGKLGRHLIETKIAACDQLVFELGDDVDWGGVDGEALGEPQEDGSRVFREAGFAICPNCSQESYVDVIVKAGRFEGVGVARLVE